MTPPLPPTAELSRKIDRLRRGHLVRRGMELLTLAIAADLALTLLALPVGLLFGLDLPVDLAALTLLALLLLREARSWPRERFALLLDRRFALADRLWSHLWYLRSPSVPREVREAQAAEALRSVDFPALSRGTGPRVPRLLWLVAPLLALLVFFDLSDFPAPPGFVGREVSRALRAVAPGQTPPTAGDAGGAAGTAGEQPAAELDFATPRVKGGGEEFSPQAPAVPGQPGPGAGGRVTDLSLPPSQGDGTGPQGAAGRISIPTGRATESYPVGRFVSPPVPRALTEEPSFDPSRFESAGSLLALQPGAARNGAAAFDTVTLARSGLDFSRYPVRYRAQMESYFKELWTWRERK